MTLYCIFLYNAPSFSLNERLIFLRSMNMYFLKALVKWKALNKYVLIDWKMIMTS